MTQRTSNASADSEERGGVGWVRGGHKASFVSDLAAELAAAIKKKKSLERRGWMHCGVEGHDF